MARLLTMQELDVEMQILSHFLPSENIDFKYEYPCSPDIKNVIVCAAHEVRLCDVAVCTQTVCMFAIQVYARQYRTPLYSFDEIAKRYRRACALMGVGVQATYSLFPLHTL